MVLSSSQLQTRAKPLFTLCRRAVRNVLRGKRGELGGVGINIRESKYSTKHYALNWFGNEEIMLYSLQVCDRASLLETYNCENISHRLQQNQGFCRVYVCGKEENERGKGSDRRLSSRRCLRCRRPTNTKLCERQSRGQFRGPPRCHSRAQGFGCNIRPDGGQG